jgi:hypothetical protein
MRDPVLLSAVVGAARLAYSLVCLWTSVARERQRGQTLVALLRAAGPGAVVEDVRADGALTVRAGGRR